ncbi:MAG: hypothetical protein JSR98_01870, partial [Proteobacteria bacterium]|nr:hypothetical protein [Pseudomonadota bacterium]
MVFAAPLRPTSVAILLGLAAAGAAHATNFEVVRADSEAVVFFDPAAVEIVPGPNAAAPGKVRRAQIVRVQRSILSEGPHQPGYVSTLTDYDCDQWTSRWRSFSAYSRT